MVDGIIMVRTVPGHERRVHRMIKSLVGIRKIYLLYGDYDLFLSVKVGGLLMLNSLVETIRDMEGVITTRTILAQNFEEIGPSETEAC